MKALLVNLTKRSRLDKIEQALKPIKDYIDGKLIEKRVLDLARNNYDKHLYNGLKIKYDSKKLECYKLEEMVKAMPHYKGVELTVTGISGPYCSLEFDWRSGLSSYTGRAGELRDIFETENDKMVDKEIEEIKAIDPKELFKVAKEGKDYYPIPNKYFPCWMARKIVGKFPKYNRIDVEINELPGSSETHEMCGIKLDWYC